MNQVMLPFSWEMLDDNELKNFEWRGSLMNLRLTTSFKTNRRMNKQLCRLMIQETPLLDDIKNAFLDALETYELVLNKDLPTLTGKEKLKFRLLANGKTVKVVLIIHQSCSYHDLVEFIIGLKPKSKSITY